MIRGMGFLGFERVACFPTAAEAEVVRGLLAASAIDARVAGTNHLAREQFPSGDIAVLVPEEEVARAREIIASARVPEEPGPAPRASQPVPVLRGAALVLGLLLASGGAVLLFAAPGTGETAQGLLVAGAVLASVAALAGRRERVRRVD